MYISERGIDLIISFEGFCAKATKCVKSEKYLTIGFGHYGKDVKDGDTITKKDAKALMAKDLIGFETKVNKYDSVYHFNQNEFDALVSFCYNVGNIDKLTANGHRTRTEIADAMLRYVNSGGKKLTGLVRRRTKERELFLTPTSDKPLYYKKYVGSNNSLDAILKKIGVESRHIGSWSSRKPLAEKNGIDNYIGSATDNLKLIELAKAGKLKRV